MQAGMGGQAGFKAALRFPSGARKPPSKLKLSKRSSLSQAAPTPPQSPAARRKSAAQAPVAEEQEAAVRVTRDRVRNSLTAQAPDLPQCPSWAPPARRRRHPVHVCDDSRTGRGWGPGRGEPARLNGRPDEPHIPAGPRDAAARPEVNNRGPASSPLRAPCTALHRRDALRRGWRLPPRVPSGRRGPEQRQRARRPESAGRAHRLGSSARSLPAPTARCGAAGIWRGPGRYLRLFALWRPAALGSFLF